jgi:hypothetical protein
MSGLINGLAFNGIGVLPDGQINAFVQVVPNVSALRSFVGLTNMGVMLLGNSAPGDGQGGLYYWSQGAFTDNGTTTIVPPAAAGQGAWIYAPLQ